MTPPTPSAPQPPARLCAHCDEQDGTERCRACLLKICADCATFDRAALNLIRVGFEGSNMPRQAECVRDAIAWYDALAVASVSRDPRVDLGIKSLRNLVQVPSDSDGLFYFDNDMRGALDRLIAEYDRLRSSVPYEPPAMPAVACPGCTGNRGDNQDCEPCVDYALAWASFACLTGDCPHQAQSECDAEIRHELVLSALRVTELEEELTALRSSAPVSTTTPPDVEKLLDAYVQAVECCEHNRAVDSEHEDDDEYAPMAPDIDEHNQRECDDRRAKLLAALRSGSVSETAPAPSDVSNEGIRARNVVELLRVILPEKVAEAESIASAWSGVGSEIQKMRAGSVSETAARPERCHRCGKPLDEGTAKVFTCCDVCWDKAYPPAASVLSEEAAPPLTLDNSYDGLTDAQCVARIARLLDVAHQRADTLGWVAVRELIGDLGAVAARLRSLVSPTTPPKCDADKTTPVETFPFNHLQKALDGVRSFLDSGPCKCGGDHPCVTDDQVRRLIATCEALAASRSPTTPEPPANRIERVLTFAMEKHAGQTDKQGEPYILHVLRVVAGVTGEPERIVAALHDVLEDTDTALVDLVPLRLTDEETGALLAITRHKQEQTYANYIDHVAENQLATVVKIADLKENLSRCAAFPSLRPRYEKALLQLSGAMPTALPGVRDRLQALLDLRGPRGGRELAGIHSRNVVGSAIEAIDNLLPSSTPEPPTVMLTATPWPNGTADSTYLQSSNTSIPPRCLTCGGLFGEGETMTYAGITMPEGYTKPGMGPYHSRCFPQTATIQQPSGGR